jgi:asparagine synthase (glutamine-hydrolysing)
MHADRPIGCLLSGGLDSSLVAALVQRQTDHPLHTFSVGMKGATDLVAAQTVADFIGSTHHHVELRAEEFLDAIPKVIKALESYDVTTVRASVGMYLLAKYIRQNTDIKVIFSGEGSDEVCQGYIYFHLQPTLQAGDEESRRLIHDLLYYDVLRADRTTAAWGLELRVPFLDTDFIRMYLGLDESLRCPQHGIEKYTLRKAFDEEKLLPPDILWRAKEAFSDGCSSPEVSWHHIIQEKAETVVTDQELETAPQIFPHNTPKTKEAYWFRSIFESHYPDMAHLIPYQWMPKWVDPTLTDPSARALKHYK